MFPDYQKLVVDYYDQKKRNNKLSTNLIFLTPANLKKECEVVCSERFMKKDEQMFRDFFGKGGTQKECLKAIQECGIDKFRPLINFLNQETFKTDAKNIFLLAWLLDFPERPFEVGKDYPAAGDTSDVIINDQDRENFDATSGNSESSGNSEGEDKPMQRDEIIKDPIRPFDPPVKEVDTQIPDIPLQSYMLAKDVIYGESEAGDLKKSAAKPSWRNRRYVIIGTLIVAIGTSAFGWLYFARTGCMYWAEDHYQPISCDQQVSGVKVIAYDEEKVKHFKKVTQQDTISYRSKGSIWYSKINKEVEFFTAAGEHPVVYGRYLHPVTDHIIDKYILKDTSLNRRPVTP